MVIIVGLGNPGREYDNTRHNVGFQVLEKLAAKENISLTSAWSRGRFESVKRAVQVDIMA